MLANDDIGQGIREFFSSAQHNSAGHRKLIHGLRKLHLESAEHGSDGEQEFFLGMVHCLNMMLAVKKSEDVVNRCLRFLVGFIVLSAEKDDTSVLGGTSATVRFIENLMLYAMEGLDAKDRLVRARLAQLMVACVNSVDELSDSVWRIFKIKMTERLFDREAAVRVQAVHAMARLQQLSLTEDTLVKGEQLLVLDVFMELLAHDPSADVRRAVLSQIEICDRSLEVILMRRRDVDAGVRKAFYAQKMVEIDVRILSIKQRDLILRAGLCDRDAGVRRACIEMVFGSWIQTANNNLIQLLFSLDVLRHTKVAESALRAFYEMTPEMFESGFPKSFFGNLTPETTLALRVYCQAVGPDKCEELVPEMSELADHMRRLYEEGVLGLGSQDETIAAAHQAEVEFILCELFKVAGMYDGADEVGKRVVQTVLVEMMANLELGDVAFEEALKLLNVLCQDMETFVATVGQLMVDLHELHSAVDAPAQGLDEQLQRSFESLTVGGASLSEDVRIMAQLRCLMIIAAAFSLPDASLARNTIIYDLLNDAVIPAVNSGYAAVQTAGLKCLGLACLLGQQLAEEYLELLLEFYRNGQDETRMTALKIVFDLIFVHGRNSLQSGTGDAQDGSLISRVHGKIVDSLQDKDSEVQAVAAEGYAKLLLHRVLSDGGILAGLLELYFHPESADNARLRQALTYFLQAFAYSAGSHQILLAHSTLPVLRALEGVEQVSIPLIGAQLLELTDHERLMPAAERHSDGLAHAVLAEELAWEVLFSSNAKLYGSVLCKIRIDASWPARSLKRLLFLMGHLIRSVTEKALLTGLKKMVAMLVELDDPTKVLSSDDLVELRSRLTTVQLPERASQPTAKSTKASSAGRQQRSLQTTNLMDEISDLLDD